MSRRIVVAAAVTGVSLTLWVIWRRRRRVVIPRVTDLLIYPIKSCAEIHLLKATAVATGFSGDRMLQVVDEEGNYCTPRDEDKVWLFHVRCSLHANRLTLSIAHKFKGLGQSPLTIDLDKPVGTAKAKVLGVPRPHDNYERLVDYGDEVGIWLELATGIERCRLVGIGPEYGRTVMLNPKQGDEVPVKSASVSLADEAPYLLTTIASLDDLNRRLQKRGAAAVDMRRFRPNIVVDGVTAWEEDTWKRIRIGKMEFWVWQRCSRCVMTTIDRDTLMRGREPLATMTSFRERDHGCRNFGMHLVPCAGVPLTGIELSFNDAVEVLEYDPSRRAEWEQLASR